jgi:hypothetical protein
VFDTQTETRHTDVFQRLKLVFVQRPGFALKRHFFCVSPTHVTIQTLDEISQLLLADIRRSAATEVSKPELSSLKSSCAAVEFVLLDQRIEVDLDL